MNFNISWLVCEYLVVPVSLSWQLRAIHRTTSSLSLQLMILTHIEPMN